MPIIFFEINSGTNHHQSAFIGFSFFKSNNTSQGMQNQMFGILIFFFVVIQMMFQIIPVFVVQRTLYEARERQSKTYAWQAFVLTNIVVEFAWNSVKPSPPPYTNSSNELTPNQSQLMAIICFVVWFYPLGVYENAQYTDTMHSRSTLALLIVWVLFLFASSMAHMLIAGVTSDELASSFANILSIMLYAFCGILAGPDALPGFWIFMYRVNPFTYVTSGLLSTSLGNVPMHCADNELLAFSAPPNQTCAEYLRPFIQMSGGEVMNPMASGDEQCQYCSVNWTNDFLRGVGIDFETRWRDFGLLWVYVVFNVSAAVFLYWLCRVPKGKKKAKE